MKCPLCSAEEFRPAWIGTVEFRNKDFTYYECLECNSFICNPMPDLATLTVMYGGSYVLAEDVNTEDEYLARRFDKVINFLGSHEKGVFIDYGCGDGTLLKLVSNLGWKVIGIEFNPDIVEKLSKTTGFEILKPDSSPTERADVLHIGDVIEHLTDLENQMPKILSLLKDNGVLIAQGPLEANPNFFNFVLKISRKIKRNKITHIPPYHVILATSKGQRKFFERHGLSELAFEVLEIDFPAPSRLHTKDLRSPRKTTLFVTRKVSKMLSNILGVYNRGNRYFYIGKKTA